MLEYVLGGILILAALFLVVAVLLQSGKGKKGLSGAITGGSDNFFGKNQTSKKEQVLSKATTIVAIVFVVVVIVAYVFQDRFEYNVPTAGTNAGTVQTDTDDNHDHNHNHEEAEDTSEATGTEAAE